VKESCLSARCTHLSKRGEAEATEDTGTERGYLKCKRKGGNYCSSL